MKERAMIEEVRETVGDIAIIVRDTVNETIIASREILVADNPYYVMIKEIAPNRAIDYLLSADFTEIDLCWLYNKIFDSEIASIALITDSEEMKSFTNCKCNQVMCRDCTCNGICEIISNLSSITDVDNSVIAKLIMEEK